MIQSILFTKEISDSLLRDFLGNEMQIRVVPTLEIRLEEKNIIENKIESVVRKHLVTSQNAARAIQGIIVEGDFFVVGHKTANMLKEQNRRIVAVEEYAADLFELHLKDVKHQKFQFFSGTSRRDYLIDQLSVNQNHIHEVVCYHTRPITNKMMQKFDAYAFFSPLSFESFIKENEIPHSSVLFSIGKTTTQAIKSKINNPIITAKNTTVEAVLETIKNYRK
ncbi:uroporphyrinogen-III synthase [Vaginella massiliensis]|uniref:uroporphyrinogen-III synthase n=1 Tax=Vaginella massiliensis TaxID=1816680 RepID=UPI0013902B00|nr:uroporphyrinogen-III synthase [Vaginella massiliensis]